MTGSVPFKVVIPARYASSRLPGKPLLQLAGKTMVEWVHGIGEASGADEVIVESDDESILDEVERFSGCCEHTGSDHVSGTGRVTEIAVRRGWSDDTIVVNLQCDEPAIPAGIVTSVASDQSVVNRPNGHLSRTLML